MDCQNKILYPIPPQPKINVLWKYCSLCCIPRFSFEKYYLHNFFITLSQQILSVQLLLILIWTYHWDYFFALLITTHNALSFKICYENIVNITYLFSFWLLNKRMILRILHVEFTNDASSSITKYNSTIYLSYVNFTKYSICIQIL